MPTPTKGPRLGGSPSHQRIILANLASQLFEHGRITTTEAKAKRLRPLAEKLITKAKRGDIHSRRSVLTTVRDKSVVHTLFTEIAPTFAGRDGGYLRITKVGPRKGDNAPMAVIELVTESLEDSQKSNLRGTSAKAAPARRAPAAASEPVEVAPGGESEEQVSPYDESPAELPGEALIGETADDQDTPSEAVPSDDVDAEEGVSDDTVPAAPTAQPDDSNADNEGDVKS